MQVSDPVLLALIGMLGAIVAGFFKMIDSQDKTHARLTGLTPGSTTFTSKYKAATQTATFSYRNITVKPL